MSAFGFVPDQIQIDWAWVADVYWMFGLTLVMLVVLELFSWNKEWQEKFQRKEIFDKYVEAWNVNLFHYIVLGPAAYAFALWFIDNYPPYLPIYISAPGFFMTQAVGYAVVHAKMHDPRYYAATHKYHHTFNERTFVRPVTANSTTTAEFAVAYIMPILTGLLVFRPNYETVWMLVSSISATNLLIHTDVDALPMGWCPSWMVTNLKHFHHHKKDVRKHYSAPILDLDSILGLVSSSEKAN